MNEKKILSHKDLIVWQKSVDLSVAIYKLTEVFPKSEVYGIVSQMRRAGVSIPSNIAEGKKRNSPKDFRHFLSMALGSGAELETQIEIAKRLGFGEKEDYLKVEETLNEVMRMLNTLSKKISLLQ